MMGCFLFSALGAGVEAQQPVAPRKLAPGVLTVIPVSMPDQETFVGPISIPELANDPKLDFTPNYSPKTNTAHEWAKSIVLRHDTWTLEFAFKPMRMLKVDVPLSTGRMEPKLVWYMVYRVKNIGARLAPQSKPDKFGHEIFTAAPFDSTQSAQPRTRFYPKFVLSGQVYENNTYTTKEYLDRIIPVALEPILRREAPGVQLYNSVQMTRIDIPLSDDRVDRSVWGVVTWEDVDPRIDFFSVYIQGLSNAFQIEQSASAATTYKHKTLQLNFWRPGDTQFENEREIRFGIPVVTDPLEQERILSRYGVKQRLDYQWIYR
jgi:hypothetical protein